MPGVYALRDPTPADTPARPWKWIEPTGYIFFQHWARIGSMRLPGQAFRLLCGVIAHTDWGNVCTATLSTIGRSVGLDRSTVHRMLPKLIAHHLVYVDRTPSQRQALTVHLSPDVLWKGRPWYRAHAQAQFRAAWQLHHGQTARGDSPHATPGEGEHPPVSHQENFSHPFIQHEPATELSAVEDIEVEWVRGEEGR